MLKNYALFILLGLVFTFSACKEDEAIPKSSAKAITKLTFPQFTPAVQATIDEATKRITAIVPPTADVTKLIPFISVSLKAKVLPDSGKVQDFTNDVTYSVTAEDGTKQDYKVMVSRTKFSGKDILTFTFADFTPAIVAKIDPATKTFTATVPATADLTKLKPTITLSDRATINPLSATVVDFTKAVNFTVTAEDAGTQVYAVTVVKEVVPVTTSKNVIYAGSSKGVYVIDALTGKKLDLLNSGVNTLSPIIDNGNLYMLEESNNKLVAFDSKTKGKRWEYTLKSSPKRPIIKDGFAYMTGYSSYDNCVSIDIANGKEKWIKSVPQLLRGTPLISNNILYVAGAYEQSLFALEASTGNTKWTYKQDNWIFHSPTIIGNDLYGASVGDIFILNSTDGKVKTIYNSFYDGGQLGAFTIFNKVMFIAGGSNERFYAVDLTTGKEKWSISTVKSNYCNPIILDGLVYFYSREYKLYAADILTGVVKWTLNDVNDNVVVADGVVYACVNGVLNALDAKNGTKKWSFAESGSILYAPTVIDSKGIVNYDGSIPN